MISDLMNTCRKVVSWREDLTHSRDICVRDVESYGFLISWFDEWRASRELEMNKVAARRFWKECVLAKNRKQWQLNQWAEAIIPLRVSKETNVIFELFG